MPRQAASQTSRRTAERVQENEGRGVSCDASVWKSQGEFQAQGYGFKISVPLGNRKLKGRIFSYENSAYFIECDEFFDREEIYGTPAAVIPTMRRGLYFFKRRA